MLDPDQAADEFPLTGVDFECVRFCPRRKAWLLGFVCCYSNGTGVMSGCRELNSSLPSVMMRNEDAHLRDLGQRRGVAFLTLHADGYAGTNHNKGLCCCLGASSVDPTVPSNSLGPLLHVTRRNHPFAKLTRASSRTKDARCPMRLLRAEITSYSQTKSSKLPMRHGLAPPDVGRLRSSSSDAAPLATLPLTFQISAV